VLTKHENPLVYAVVSEHTVKIKECALSDSIALTVCGIGFDVLMHVVKQLWASTSLSAKLTLDVLNEIGKAEKCGKYGQYKYTTKTGRYLLAKEMRDKHKLG